MQMVIQVMVTNCIFHGRGWSAICKRAGAPISPVMECWTGAQIWVSESDPSALKTSNLRKVFLLCFDCLSLAFLQIEDHSPAMSLHTTCSTLSISAPLVQPAHDLTNCTTARKFMAGIKEII